MGNKFVLSVEHDKGDERRVVISDLMQRECEVITLASLAKRARRIRLAGGFLGIDGVDADGNVVSDGLVPWRNDIAPERHRLGTLDEITLNRKNDNKPLSSKFETVSLAARLLGADAISPATIMDKITGAKIFGALGEFYPIADLVGLYHSLNTSEGYDRYNAPDISWAYIHLFVDNNSFVGNPNATLERLVAAVLKKCISLGICTILDSCVVSNVLDDTYSVYFLCPVHTAWLLDNFVNPYLRLMSQLAKGRKVIGDGILEDDHFVVVTHRAKSSFFFKFNGYYLRLNNMLPAAELEQYMVDYQTRVGNLRRTKLANTFDKYIGRVWERHRCGKEDSPSAKSVVKFNQTATSEEGVRNSGLSQSGKFHSEHWLPIEDYISFELSPDGKLVATTDKLSGSVFPESFDSIERDATSTRIERNWRLVCATKGYV